MLPEGSKGNTLKQEFFAAAAAGDAVLMKRLIEAGMDVNAMDMAGKNGRTALMFAARAGHAEVVRILIQAGADVNAQGAWNETALMSATQGGSTEVVKILLDCGAGP